MATMDSSRVQNQSLPAPRDYKPTDSHSYLLHSSSHPNHVKNLIPYYQFLRFRRLCSDELDFSNKSEEMLQFFKNRGYPDSVVKTVQQRAQTTNQRSAPQTSQKEENQRIPFTLTFHPLNLPVKNITDRLTCTSANAIYCIKCTLCKKIYIGVTGRRLGDRFREHVRDVERNDKDASKPVERHLNLPNHFTQNMAIRGLSMHQGNTESRKRLEEKFIFQLGLNERFSFV